MTTTHREQTVRITSLAYDNDILEDLRFENCQIIGPALLYLMEDVGLDDCEFDTPDFESTFWPVEPERHNIVGPIGLRNVHFTSCAFSRIGFAVNRDEIARLREGFLADPE